MSKLFSCNYSNESNIEKLTIESLTKIACEARQITIVSAYYSVRFFDTLFQSIPRHRRSKCKICIILNGFGGFRLEEQQIELKELELRLIKSGYKIINIYLNTGYSLFHTKLYMFKLKNKIKWFIGSANSSLSAFSSNEEILLMSTEKHRDFEKYIENVISKSQHYDKIDNLNINNMVKFWRTGIIYYKPNANIQFTFSILKIPGWVNNELSQLDNMPPFASPGDTLGPFNLKLALDVEDSVKPNSQARHNPWSIETCFGYWVPSKYKNKLDEKIIGASQRKLEKLNDINSKINAFGKSYILEQFNKYIEGVEANLSSVYRNFKWVSGDRIVIEYQDEYYNGTVETCRTKVIKIIFDDGYSDKIKKDDPAIAGVGKKRKRKRGFNKQQLKSYLSKEFWHTPKNSQELFKTFLNRIIKRLNDERYKKRSCVPLISSTMPEIWSDSVAIGDFSESFFEYISFKLNLDSKPSVIKSLIKKCDIFAGNEFEEVHKKIEFVINQYGWSDEDWI